MANSVNFGNGGLQVTNGSNSLSVNTSAIAIDGKIIAGHFLLNTIIPGNQANVNDNSSFSDVFSKYIIDISQIFPRANNVHFYMQVSPNGTIYDTGANYSDSIAQGATQFQLFSNTANVSTSDTGLSGTITLYNPASSSKNKNIISILSGANSAIGVSVDGGSWAGNVSIGIRAIKLYFSSGNVDSFGHIKIYGVK